MGMKFVGVNVVMTVIGFAVSTMFIVFVCTRLICARLHLRRSSHNFPTPTAFASFSRSNLTTILERGLHGLESVVIANFPTKRYNDTLFASSEDAKCIVCLVDYVVEDMLRILPNCGHSFHAACIDRWLQQHSTCPVCRISLRDFPERLMPPMFSSAVRSQYGIETFDSRVDIECQMQPVHRNRFVSECEGDEGIENASNSNKDRPVEKTSESKHMESPSDI